MSANSDAVDGVKRELKRLNVQRQALEAEAEAIVSELTAPTINEGDGPDGPPMGIDTPLVDGDGYPRADVDVMRARTLRHRLAEIRTDHKRMSKDLETGLMRLKGLSSTASQIEDEAELAARRAPKPKPKFDKATGKWVVFNWDGTTVAGTASSATGTTDSSAQGTTGGVPTSIADGGGGAAPTTSSPAAAASSSPTATEEAPPQIPFAVVDGVAADSPASEAGLKEGDLVVRFGDVNYLNHRNLKRLAELVPEAAGDHADIEVVVLRRRSASVDLEDVHGVEAAVHVSRTVKIRPRPWGGRGLLGCHIVAYTDTSQAQYHEPAVSS